MGVSSTYAEALHEAAVADGNVTEVATQLADLREAIGNSPELNQLLHDPDTDTAAKKRVMGSVLEGSSPIVSNFVQVLLDRGRADMLGEIADAFSQRVADAEGRLRVVVRTAIALPDDLRAQVVTRIEQHTGRPIDVETVVDDTIVGGVVIETENSVVDASVRHRLEQIQQSMQTVSVQDAVAAD